MVGIALLGAMLVQGAAQDPLPAVVTRSRVDPSRSVDFHAMVTPDTIYVGQQASYELGVFLDADVRQRIRRNPEFQPPATRDLLSYELRDMPGGSISATIGGRPYEVHVFQRALFALAPGRYRIPQARLTYALPRTESFFSREENYTLRSEDVSFVVIEPPLAGRPAEWAGAVGVWRAGVRLDSTRAQAGEPIVLTLRIEGQGNVTLLPRPRLTVPWASVVNADERVHLDSTPPLLGGWKEFDWLVSPAETGVRRLPAVRFAFFNPRARRYEFAESRPLDVRVSAGVAAPSGGAPAAPPSPDVHIPTIMPALGRGAWPLFGTTPAALAVVVVAPLVALGVWLARRPARPRPEPTADERLATAAAAAAVPDADVARLARLARLARHAFVTGLRTRTGLDPGDFTDVGTLAAALRKIGVGVDTAATVERLLAEFDDACFSAAGPGSRPSDLAERGRAALRAVDTEACGAMNAPGRRRRFARAAARGLGVVCAASVAFAAHAPASWAQSGADAFASGVTAYAGGDYLRAARYFDDAARAEPASVAAWTNLGAAAILARDTATAVVAWQTALRLDPTNGAARAGLAGVRAPQDQGYAAVPALPEQPVAVAALLVWAAGWMVVAWQTWHRRPVRRLALTTLVLGSSALGATWLLDTRLASRDLAVVLEPVALRTVPALGADAGATPMTGEVGRITDREGVWVRIRLDDVRWGWIPAERVRPLGRD